MFVGLGTEPDQVVIASPGAWPINADVGGEHCAQHVKTGATKGLRAISCPYARPGSGGARTDRNDTCWAVAGYSDGVLGVNVTDNEPEISETDMMQWKEERKSAQQIRRMAWEKLAAGAFNYLMLSCDRKLLKTSY